MNDILNLDDPQVVLNECREIGRKYEYCRDDGFWMLALAMKFGDTIVPPEFSPRQYYLKRLKINPFLQNLRNGKEITITPPHPRSLSFLEIPQTFWSLKI